METTPIRLCHQGAASGPEKGGLVRRLKRAPPDAAILFEDETTLRWFPPLRASWAPQGTQAQVRITGQNAKRVLFGAINLRTGHRIVLRRRRAWQQDFQAFLRELRRRYRRRPIYLLLDAASCHTAVRSQRLAQRLDIVLLWLPKQCPELNSMDHLWRELKGRIAANRQYDTIDDEAAAAEAWVLGLTPTQARRKAGIRSKHFWLRALF